MSQKIKIVMGAAVFALLIAVAMYAYNVLQDNVSPEITLAEQPANVSVPDSQSETTAQSESTEPEKIKAPDFTVEELGGSSVKLSDMEGKPVVLNFWASWCPPCKAEMPEFDRVFAELGSEVTFMMVNLTDGQRETKKKAMEYVDREEFSFPVYYDTEQEAGYVYGVRSIPTTIFIDSEGYIVTGAEGQIDEKTLRYGISLIQNSDDMVSDADVNAEYRKISAGEAHEMMKETDSLVLLDVRTDEEYKENHIEGAVLIPDYEITERAESELIDKNALILVYCRSGRRSAYAAQELVNMGYTNVYDFGGIIDWPYGFVAE